MASSLDSQPTRFDRKFLRWWLVVCAVVGAALCLSQLLEIRARSALRGYDNTFNYLWLRSAMVDGDWDFRNDLELCDTLGPEYRASALSLPLTAAGRIPNKYGIGWSLLTLPFYVLADGLVSAGRGLNLWSYQNDGFNPVYQVCVQLGHAGLALLALWMATVSITRWLGSGRARPSRKAQERLGGSTEDFVRSPGNIPVAAIFGVISVWAASPLIYYQTANVSMSHGAAFFAVSLLAYALSRNRIETSRYGWWGLAGAAMGLAVIVRYQLVIFALPVGWQLFKLRRERWKLLAASLCFLGGVTPFIALQLFAWRSVYGEWLVFSYGAEGESFHWLKPEILNSLVSPWHGTFYWHPYLLVALSGMLAWAWKQRGEAATWSVCVGLMLYVNAAWWCWWFASSFGNRGYDAALLPMMAGAAWMMQHLERRGRVILWITAMTLGLWNFYVVLLYRTGAISRSQSVTWHEMIQAVTRLGEAAKF